MKFLQAICEVVYDKAEVKQKKKKGFVAMSAGKAYFA